ncbi:hypothetical protein EA459_07855 [Streptococcus dysgalactiae subsp. dysgalactiae]|nr:abortive infection system toxin AbiGii family protein [Streptococcus dysgalactiae]QGG98490.1 hypothetical protein EA459_07855 [Streptococcus dysgalactiae subsp. dysgalactiae]
MGKLKNNFTRSRKKIEAIPKALKKNLDLDAPEGLEYQPFVDNIGLFALGSKDGKGFNFKIDKIKLPREIQGMKVTTENIADILYVTQTSVDITDTDVIINGKSYGKPDEVLIKNITGKKNSKQELVVPSFPTIDKPIHTKIGDELVDFKVKRVPYPSLTDIKIINENYEFIKLELIISKLKKGLKLKGNISFDLSFFDTVSDVLKNRKILEGIAKNEVILLDFETEKNIKEKGNYESVISFLDFYQKLGEIGKKLNIEFKNESSYNRQSADLIKQLYVSLILDSFFYMDINKNNIHNFIGDNVPEAIIKAKEEKSPLAFYSVSEFENEVFGKKLHYYKISIYENIYVTNIIDEINEKKVEFKFLDQGQAFEKIVFEHPSENVDFVKLHDNLKTIDIATLKW